MVTRQHNAVGITSRGPLLSDNNFILDVIRHETVTAGSQGEPYAVDEVLKAERTSAIVDYHYTIQPSWVAGDDNYTYISTNESIAIINAEGETTRIGDGVVRILVKARNIIRCVDLDHTRQESITAVVDVGWVDGSLASDCANTVDGLIDGRTPSTAKPMYTSQDPETGIYIRNPDCLAAGIDLSCISPWNNYGDTRRRATLISPRHIIGAKHYDWPIGTVFCFVAMDNSVVYRTLIDRTRIHRPGTLQSTVPDITIGLLDSDLPANISFVQIIGPSIFDYMSDTAIRAEVPGLKTDQENKILTCGIGVRPIASPDRMWSSLSSFSEPFDAAAATFWEPTIANDSGNDAFLIVDNELALVTKANYSTWGPTYVHLIDVINTVMTTLGGGYQLTVKNLSTHPTY